MGHTESVAGLTGLIKTILMLEKKMIPPNATFMKPNSDIPLESWGMEVRIETLSQKPPLLSCQAGTDALCAGA